MCPKKKIHPHRSRTERAWGGKSFEPAQSNHASSILALFCNLLLLVGLTTMAVAQPGTITTVVGTGVAGYSGDGGPAITARINSPRNLFVDGSGNLYIADRFNHCIRKVTPGGIITTVAGTVWRVFPAMADQPPPQD